MKIRNPLVASIVAAFIAVALIQSPLEAAPPRGSVAPPITLKDLSGETVSTTKFANKALILVFGELGNDGAKQACADVLDVLADPRLSGEPVVPILVIARDASPSQLKEEATQGRFPALILHDPKREAFGAYRVLVVPTLVVVDPKSKVVYSMPGYLQKSKDLLLEAVLTSVGKEPVAQFEQSIDPKAQNSPTPEVVKSDRLVHLGVELTKHGMYDIAELRFKEAIALVPGHVGATLGLGELMLKQNKLPDAERYFRSLLAGAPESVDALVGIATVQVRRGGDDLAAAETTLKPVIEKNPKLPKARFLIAQIHELRGDIPGAMAEYKVAAELLLER